MKYYVIKVRKEEVAELVIKAENLDDDVGNYEDLLLEQADENDLWNTDYREVISGPLEISEKDFENYYSRTQLLEGSKFELPIEEEEEENTEEEEN